MAGVSDVAGGLLISAVVRMAMLLIRKRDATGLLVMAVVLAAIGLLRLPLPAVLLVRGPGQLCDRLGEAKEPS